MWRLKRRRSMSARLRKMARDLGWGLRWGLSAAIGLCGVAVLIYLLFGSQPFERIDTTLIGTFAFYLAGGLVGGIVLGVCRPWVHTPLGAAVVGVLVAFPVVTIGFVMVDRAGEWRAYDTIAVIVVSLIFGVAGGLGEWSRNERERHRSGQSRF